MSVYFILLSSICLLWFFLFYFKVKRIQARKIFMAFSFLAIVLVAGLRDISVGTDTRTYVTCFLNRTYFQFEPAYALLSALVRTLTANWTVYLIVLAIVMYGTIFCAIAKIAATPPHHVHQVYSAIRKAVM